MSIVRADDEVHELDARRRADDIVRLDDATQTAMSTARMDGGHHVQDVDVDRSAGVVGIGREYRAFLRWRGER